MSSKTTYMCDCCGAEFDSSIHLTYVAPVFQPPARERIAQVKKVGRPAKKKKVVRTRIVRYARGSTPLFCAKCRPMVRDAIYKFVATTWGKEVSHGR